MKFSRFAGAAGAALAAAALLAGPASATRSGPRAPCSSRPTIRPATPSSPTTATPDGSLQQAGSYRTGGLGGVLDGSVVDHLASQGSLHLDRAHGLLYAVNAGSDTITVFGVDGDRLVRRQVLPSFGDFPVSIAVHGNLVYVLNARGGGSVQGYVRVGRVPRADPALAPRRSASTRPPTPEFTHTPGPGRVHARRRPACSSPPRPTPTPSTCSASTGSAACRCGRRRPSLPDAVPFAVAFDARGNLAVAEAGPNAVATFGIDRRGALTPIAQAATGQAATCWIVNVGGRLYLSNAGSAHRLGLRRRAAAGRR